MGDKKALKVPLLKATVYTQVMRSPLAPLKKGGTGVKVPLFKGDLGGSPRDQRCYLNHIRLYGDFTNSIDKLEATNLDIVKYPIDLMSILFGNFIIRQHSRSQN